MVAVLSRRAVLVLLALLVLVLLVWVALAIVARRQRLRPGQLLPLLGAAPGALRRLRADPRVPPRVRIVVLLTLLWVVSPIDLIPEFLPVIGPLDDVVVVVLALRHVMRHVPRAAVIDAWPPAHRPVLEDLLGPGP